MNVLNIQPWMEVPALVGWGLGVLISIAFFLWLISRDLYKIRKMMERHEKRQEKKP